MKAPEPVAPPAPPEGLRVRPVALPVAWSRGLKALAFAAAIVVLFGWVAARERTCTGILLASQYVLGISLGALALIALCYVTRAGWIIAIRRVPEALSGAMTVGIAATLIAAAGIPWLYEWSHADTVAKDPILQSKSGWLSVGGFLVRTVLFLGIWYGFAWAIRRFSRRQDETHGVDETNWNTILSAIFLVVFALTFSLASFDWLMSLEPHWYSTVFAIYNFAGVMTSSLAVMILILIALRRSGHMPQVRPDHLHDLGKLAFAFSMFWGYIWFCQYMLIWYGNIPEETQWFVHRQEGAWSVLHVANPIVCWLIPFLALLPREAKRTESVLIKVAIVLLIGRWLDLFYIVNPPVMHDGPTFSIWELAPMVVALAALVLVFVWTLRRGRLVPEGDPYLVESLHHET